MSRIANFVIVALLALHVQMVAAMEEFNMIVTTDEICALIACRKPSSVMVYGATPDHDLVITTPKSPFVFQGLINLISGERIAYMLDLREGRIRDMRRLYPEPPGKYFSISLSQPEAGLRGNSQFSLHNVLEQPVTFGLDIVKAGNLEPEPRLICEVAADTELTLPVGLQVYQVFVTDLEVVADVIEGSGRCQSIIVKGQT